MNYVFKHYSKGTTQGSGDYVFRKYSESVIPQIQSYLSLWSYDTFGLQTSNLSASWDGTLEYYNFDGTWTEWDGNGIIGELQTSQNETYYEIRLRGIGNTQISNDRNTFEFTTMPNFGVHCYGNIETLLDYSTVLQGLHPPMAENCFIGLFQNTQLIETPALSATTLAEGCYHRMFKNCIALKTLPELPAITIESYSYYEMFQGCSLIKLSTTPTGQYTIPYRIPSVNNGTRSTYSVTSMFSNTGGTFRSTPTINKTYYLSNTNWIIPVNS